MKVSYVVIYLIVMVLASFVSEIDPNTVLLSTSALVGLIIGEKI